MTDHRLHRRALLLGAGGVLLAGCGKEGGTASKPEPGGPIINTQDTGTVISKKELDAFVQPLNDAVRAGDVNAMKAVLPDLDVTEWRTRLASMKRFPLEDVGFVFEDTSDRTMNASGGKLEVSANVVLTHRVKGCDARLVVQQYDAHLTKDSPDTKVKVGLLSGPSGNDAPWDMPGGWQVFQADHVVVTARTKHAAEAKRRLADLDRGAAAAMRIVPPAKGISRMMIAVDEPSSQVFGGSDLPERDGFASRMDYIDPEVAAREGGGSTSSSAGKPAGKEKRIFATSRIVIRPGGLVSSSEAYDIALHETIHGLALQWSPSAPSWVAEGLATWGEEGGASGFRRSSYAGLVRSGFGAFSRTFQGFDRSWDWKLFQKQSNTIVRRNYGCSAAIFCAMEAAKGKRAAIQLAAHLYEDDVIGGPQKSGFKNQQALFDFAQKWVSTL